MSRLKSSEPGPCVAPLTMVEQFLAQVVRMLEPWFGLPQRAAHFTSNLNFHLRFSLRVFFLFHFQPSVSVARSPCIHLTSSDLPDTATYCTPSFYGGGLNYTRASCGRDT
ncbi:hypothetical protein QC761_0049210 [Podospora bellae-mahoneyi]|uniref:Uncharacterized protein n=1 Tax=Podospora bellae-mahoneyi TaxID=2093777 RepID=A0ABR0FJW4_9PEZI|nr:hypothetical protein QC761_0049210 [Podospora bellae-mahoneyi]